MVNHWDWTVIGVYFAFMIAIGVACKRLNSNSSDYFRGGGQMLWWMSGTSMCISSISLWTFSAAGVRVYETGFYQVIAYLVAILGIPPLYFYFAKRFRRMRVITSADAVRRRYGRASEQVWVWITVPINVFYSGVGLHIIALFVAAALNIEVHYTAIGLGVVITFMAILGGAWAVSASDFIQGLVTMVVATLVCIKTMLLPEVGGLGGFADKLPEEFVNFNLWSREIIWVPWLITQAITTIFRVANINDTGSYFLKVKNDRHAQWQVILYAFTPVLPLLVFLPIMASAWVIPNMEALFPTLNRAEEGAYVAIATKVLPQGMVGLLVCTIFAVQMSSLDTGLNKSAGFVVCNFYRDILRPKASEKELLWVGMLFTCFFGVLIIAIALLVTAQRDANIFEFTLLLAPILQLPMVIPMIMTVVMKKTPGWSAWSSALVGILAGVLVNLVWLDSDQKVSDFAGMLGLATPLSRIEAADFRFIIAYTSVISSTLVWFVATRFFWNLTTEAFKLEVDRFFADMNIPIGEHPEDAPAEAPGADLALVTEDRDRDQYTLIGWMTVAYGVIITAGIVIPNDLNDRLLFALSGGIITLVGAALLWQRKRRTGEEISAPPTTQPLPAVATQRLSESENV
ncbi:sodium:solute symporter family transporter [Algisphaera agarilytica]|uniref:Na+/proline symporter n=1 Tax=Algisphaera agarilytica TaxID=1385975 RepID=A0A7X0H4K6_9BACT|nr:hypothetical protein [Algisphaera agarilytica]MBB6429177.1 Na+/proline symporter [Algisphaera agarilytica]